RDLATVHSLAEAIRDGLPPFEAAATIRGLAMSSPLWQMRMNCVRYCRFVEAHHFGETHHLFPHLRRINPDLAAVLDKLDADHVAVAGHLEQVEAAAKALGELGTPEQRSRLVNALEALARDLLAHLDFEEERLGPTLRTLTHWPWH